MIVRKSLGKVIGATFTKAEQQAFEIELKRQIHTQEQQYCNDKDALILYVLHAHLGFGKKRLREFYEAYSKELANLTEYYEMPGDDVYLARLKLKEIGVDIEEWNKETGGYGS